MPNYLSPVFNEQTFNASGSPLVGGQIETYIAGTSTPLASYTTQNGTTQQSNPIILNSRGEPTNPIWLGSGLLYKFILKDAVGVSLRTIDNVGGVNDSSLSVSEWVASGVAPTFISTTSFSVVGDRTADFTPGRRTRSTNSGGTVYSTISAVSYSIGTGLTTVTVVNDSTPLDAGLSAVDVGILNPAFRSYPANGQEVRIDVASAATVNLTTSAPSTRNIRITGTTTITAFTVAAGQTYFVSFSGALTLTNNASIVTNTGANITTAAGDSCIIRATAANTVEVISYDRVSSILGNQIQPIVASVAANALTVTLNPTSLDFRSATLGTGTPVNRNVSTAISVVVPSGATLGTVNAVQSDIVVLAIDNAGTVELAVVNIAGGVDLSETGVISTTTISAGATSASVIYSTTGRTNVAYRVVGVVRSTQATAGTWASAPTLVQGAGGQAQFRGASMVRVNTANGYGSTNTRIRRFTNIDANQGSDITYADSATLGGSFTINTAGVYAISYTDNFSSVTWLGISRNTTAPTTNISTLAIGEVVKAVTVAGANLPSGVSETMYFPAGTVIRAHTDAGAVGTAGANGCMFTITRVA